MAILCLSTILPNFNQWIKNIHAIDPALDVRTMDNHGNLAEITSVLAWKPDDHIFKKLPNLKFIQSAGMGIDHLLECSNIPQDTIIARIIDHDMREQMAEYVLYGAFKAYRNIQYYNQQQTDAHWQMKRRLFKDDITIGVLGLGELGAYVSTVLQQHDFNVIGWKNSEATRKDITVPFYHGQHQLAEFLQQCNILVCLLPLTPETKHIINDETLALLPLNAYIINPARGGHIHEQALLKAIQSHHISGALLDVFETEPLPSEHPFWRESAIEITPHIAAQTNPITASIQVTTNFQRVQNGLEPYNIVDLKRGY